MRISAFGFGLGYAHSVFAFLKPDTFGCVTFINIPKFSTSYLNCTHLIKISFQVGSRGFQLRCRFSSKYSKEPQHPTVGQLHSGYPYLVYLILVLFFFFFQVLGLPPFHFTIISKIIIIFYYYHYYYYYYYYYYYFYLNYYYYYLIIIIIIFQIQPSRVSEKKEKGVWCESKNHY